QLKGNAVEATARVGGGAGSEVSGGGQSATPQDNASRYRGAQGLDPEFIADLERQFGFDKPMHERFFMMMGNYLTFDFGESYFQDRKVVDLVIERMPVSISLGLWTAIIIYLVCIPLGVLKAVRDGSRFDVWTSGIVIIGNAIPSFLFAILLIILFAGGRYLDWFPLRGLTSPNWDDLSWPARILDYFWHLALPLTALLIGSFATLTMLTKNSFIDQIHQQYVVTARSKGLTERRVLYGHIFRNGMLIVIAGIPGALIGILFTGSLLIEVIFSLNGLGLLGFEAAIKRDYPIMFGTIYFYALMGLLLRIIGDLTYMFVDPRIHFERQDA
ncbi:MAG: microcin C ABC transporter permease YejB, partial [Rhodospirillales bacterium]|nr:microcin C ABC transporter permease YejB [Rhodospirillales bacterium]